MSQSSTHYNHGNRPSFHGHHYTSDEDLPEFSDSVSYSKEKVEIPKYQIDALTAHNWVGDEDAIRIIGILGFEDALAYKRILLTSSSIDESLYVRNAEKVAEIKSKTGLTLLNLDISPLEIAAIDVTRKFNVRDRRLHR